MPAHFLSLLYIAQLLWLAIAGPMGPPSAQPFTLLRTEILSDPPPADQPVTQSARRRPRSPASSTGTAYPTAPPSTDPTTLQDINTIHVRRLPFIVSGVSGASTISAWLSTLGPDGKWPDSEIDYTTGCAAQRANWPAQVHWTRLVTMSAAFHGGLKDAEQWVNSSSLREAITLAMDFWFSNDFTNPSCIDSGETPACPCGTPGFWNANWFSNIIGIPKLMGQSCLLLNDTLTSTQLGNCTKISSRSYAQFMRNINGVGMLTGANTLDVASIGIDSGLLTVNASLVSDAYSRVHDEVVIHQSVRADGIRPDGSFGQHSGLIYNGNYGKDYVNDVLFLEIDAANTKFAAGSASKSAFSTLIDGDLWMIYRNVLTGVLHWDFSVLNRFISFPVADTQATASIKINITQIQVLGREWNSETLTNAFKSLSETTSNANSGRLSGNRNFYANDYMVQRGSGYVTTLRMYSSRTTNSECINSQNPFGFHLADGTAYTYLQGDEYEDIAAAWDWNLIPGITVDYAATPLTCDASQFAGIESFVGGVSDGQVGIGVMRYTNPRTRALSWQKAWFFLPGDAQHVMINSISSASAAPVFSVLDQRRHNGDVLVDGAAVGSGNFSNVSTLWHGNVGYTFPKGGHAETELSLSIGPRSGNWSTLGISIQPPTTVNLFAAWLHHTNTSAATSYTAFPATDYQTFVQKNNAVQISEVQNDRIISALFDFTHRTGMAVFWQTSGGRVVLPSTQPGEACITVQSNRALAVILQESTWTLIVSDPSQSFTSAQVTLTLGAGKKRRGWPAGSNNSIQTQVNLPSSGTAGSSVVVPLKR